MWIVIRDGYVDEAWDSEIERETDDLVEIPDEQWEVYKAILTAKEELEDHWRNLKENK